MAENNKRPIYGDWFKDDLILVLSMINDNLNDIKNIFLAKEITNTEKADKIAKEYQISGQPYFNALVEGLCDHNKDMRSGRCIFHPLYCDATAD